MGLYHLHFCPWNQPMYADHAFYFVSLIVNWLMPAAFCRDAIWQQCWLIKVVMDSMLAEINCSPKAHSLLYRARKRSEQHLMVYNRNNCRWLWWDIFFKCAFFPFLDGLPPLMWSLAFLPPSGFSTLIYWAVTSQTLKLCFSSKSWEKAL